MGWQREREGRGEERTKGERERGREGRREKDRQTQRRRQSELLTDPVLTLSIFLLSDHQMEAQKRCIDLHDPDLDLMTEKYPMPRSKASSDRNLNNAKSVVWHSHRKD